LVQHRRRAPARCRHRPGSAWRGCKSWPSLCAASDGKAWYRGHRARLARRLQRRGGYRPAGESRRGLPGDVRAMSDSGMDLRELYQDIILDRGRHPRNFRALEHPTHLARGHNPLCGDRVTVYLAVEGERIADVSFEGRGCAISTAAASLMTEVLKGKTVAEARALFAQFHARVT